MRRILLAVFTVLCFLGAAIVYPQSAGATHGKPWHVEDDMVWSNDAEDRATLVLDPGRGNFLQRQQLFPHAGTYEAFGYTPNFLWYAPETRLTISQSTPWSGCAGGVRPPLTMCETGIETDPAHTIGRTFGNDTSLAVLEHKGHFIALACGNFRTNSNPYPDRPIPSISGAKFHDQSRDGVRNNGEPGLGGWEIVVRRTQSYVDQADAEFHLTADGNGNYRFPLDGQGPGVYTVEEVQRDGWHRTTAATRTIDVGFGIGDHEFGGNDFGNVESRADVVKADFTVVDPPARIEADQPTPLHVRAVLRNLGPANPVDVEDTMRAAGPADCVVVPETQAVRRRLNMGEDTVVDFAVTVTCGEPSFHEFRFANDLTIVTPDVEDPAPANNHREATAAIPVFDRADVRVDGVYTDCDATGQVDVAFACRVTVAASNAGPHPEALTDVSLGLIGPADCAAEPVGPTSYEDVPLHAGQTALTADWSVTCGDRSHHELTGHAAVSLDHLHVEDPDGANNSASSSAVVGVFEDVDLQIRSLDLTCTRTTAPGSYDCGAHMSVHNAGPADAVMTTTSLTLAVTPGCSATATTPETQNVTLATDQTASVSAGWSVVCPPASDAVITVSGLVRNADDEPHAVDSASATDVVMILGGVIDVKPRSFPSSINPDKQGTVPVAILSTPDFDAWTEVVRSSLRFGRTGTEASLLRCGGEPEDVNDDGYPDLVCGFQAQLTGLTCGDTVAYLTAALTDGTLYEAVGDVNIVPCDTQSVRSGFPLPA